MARQGGLGKGLAALLPDWQPSQLQELSIQIIEKNPRQPRQQFDALDDLAASIREHGMLQPLVVSVLPGSAGEAPRYRLIAGERRLQAAILAGLERVPAIVRESTEQELIEFALIENIQREDLNALEEAQAYRMLVEDFGLSHEEVAQRVGKSRSAVANTLRLLQAPPSVQEALRTGSVTEGHARALLPIESASEAVRLLEVVIHQQLNVRQTEQLVRQALAARTSSPSPPPPLEQTSQDMGYTAGEILCF
ncbi:MAG: ParB/RepB/Spo0J family partition protein, partial [Chloroflexi bacterium]|nr:ParB/RepB/Spo0J family partition protein [Chloroflexota bacterium]